MTINRQAIQTMLCAAAITGVLHGQTAITQEKSVAFQYFINNAESGPVTAMRVESMSGKAITGKPFSATEVRRTRQTLGDGTHIDKVEKAKFYRDFDGRTRAERENGTSVVVSDPATGSVRESANGKSRVMMTRTGTFPATAPGVEKTVILAPQAEAQMHKELLEKARAEAAATAVSGPNVFTRIAAAPMTASEKGASEDLGDQLINGVMARGTRTTITIPQGQIGNDREIKVVSERWFSNDLGLLIKSSNNDPRFGETTFELTDILRGAQDPTLFAKP